jgi:hypothetical protein
MGEVRASSDALAFSLSLSPHMEKFAAWENLHRHSAELMDAKLVKGVSPALARLYRCASLMRGNFLLREF